ncbi:exodeoxyribonuclease VII [Petrotoga sp. 9PWA.NaAc.5.4]|nr:exodeoxyribonuclease VII [Petrotoga sp. 9PWA.NaAc.5.4]
MKEMSFKKQLELLERINDYFQNEQEDLDIENALEIYKKALEILTYAREKLITLKEEKIQIDAKYEKIKNQLTGE